MTFAGLVLRHLGWRTALIPVAFLLVVLTIAAFALGPAAVREPETARGLIWTAVTLAFLLPIPLLFGPDRQDGVIDQLRVSGMACESIAAARMLSLFLSLAPVLLVAAFVAGRLFGLALETELLPLLVGMAGLSALATLAAALTGETAVAEAVAALVVLPLAVPVVIFGSGGSLPLLSAATLVLLAVCQFAAGAALREG